MLGALAGAVAGFLVVQGVLLGVGVWGSVLVDTPSMMHLTASAPFGHVGTLDLGDLALVEAVRERSDLCTARSGEASCASVDRFGGPGDVVAFFPGDDRAQRPLIRRAMAWVEVGVATGAVAYDVEGYGRFGPEGLYIPELGIDEERGYSAGAGYRPPWSGILTKGDNHATNPAVDQVTSESPGPVILDWMRGDYAGRVTREIPWVGIGKLARIRAEGPQLDPDWSRVGRVYVPPDVRLMYYASLAVMWGVIGNAGLIGGVIGARTSGRSRRV